MFSCQKTLGIAVPLLIFRTTVLSTEHRPADFHSPRDPYADGRIIAGQPHITPTPASRMPVAGNPTPRVFTNEDLEARRNMRERIVNVGRNSSSQNPSAEMERMRQERSRVDTGAASGFANGASGTTGPRIRTIPSISAPGQTAPTRSYDNWNNDGSSARSEQRQRIYRLDTPGPSSTEPSGQRQSPSTWARPTAPCLIHPSIPQPVLPRTQATGSLLASECMKCTVGERTQAERIVTRHSPFSGRPRRLGTIPTHLHRLRRP